MTDSVPIERTIGDQVARGAVWTISMRLVIRLLGVVNVAILARVLTKADFGLIALMMALSALLVMLLDTMVRSALVRMPALRDEHYGAAFWMRLASGVLVAALMAGLADPAGRFYAEPLLASAFRVFALIIFLEGLTNPWVISFQRNLQFRKDFLYETCSGVVRIAGTIAFALWFRNFWGIIAGIAVGVTFRVIFSHILCFGKPFRTDRAAVKDVWGVTRWSAVSATASFSEDRLDRLILGKLSSIPQVGVFSTVLDLVTLPVSNIVLPIGRAVLPGLQKVKAQRPDEAAEAYGVALGGMIAACIPVAVGLALVADPLIRTVLSDKWADAVRVAQVAAPFAFADGAFASLSQVFVTEGRFRRMASLQWFRVLCYLPLMVVGYHAGGLVGAVAAKSLVALVVFGLTLVFLSRVIKVGWRAVAAQVLRSLLASSLMAGILLLANDYITATFATSWGELIVISLFGAGLYIVISLIIWVIVGRPKGLEERLLKMAAEFRGVR